MSSVSVEERLKLEAEQSMASMMPLTEEQWPLDTPVPTIEERKQTVSRAIEMVVQFGHRLADEAALIYDQPWAAEQRELNRRVVREVTIGHFRLNEPYVQVARDVLVEMAWAGFLERAERLAAAMPADLRGNG